MDIGRAALGPVSADLDDALNRFRFRTDAQSLAAWKSARDMAWPMPPVEKEEKPAA